MTANKATTKENREDKGTRGPVQEDQHRNNWRPRKRESRERKKKIQEHFPGLMEIHFQTEWAKESIKNTPTKAYHPGTSEPWRQREDSTNV